MATPPIVPSSVRDAAGRQYSFGRKLGKGGFAICHQAQVGGETIALKVVKTVDMNQKVQDKFLTELQIHSKVRHKNIVGFHWAFTSGDNTYVSLELCSQGSLKEMIQQRKRLSLPEVRRYGLQLCGALHYLHSRSVVHRDIKTANILLDHDMNIKLGDFGLAAVLMTDEEMGEVKRRVTVCGTPNYIAPEILRKKQGHDTKADIWSLGVLFFNMLTGIMPFSKPEDKDNKAVFERVAEGSFQWPDSSNKYLTPDAKDLVNSLLQPLDEDRPEAITIVQHVFFKAAPIPGRLDSLCVKETPVWLKKTYPREMRAAANPRISLEQMLLDCGLVESNSSLANRVPLTHRLMEEVARNLVPTIPLQSIYERMDSQLEPSLKAKPRKLKTTSMVSVRPTAAPEPCIMIGSQEGHILADNSPDLQLLVRNLSATAKGQTTTTSGLACALPPSVAYCCEQIDKWGVGFILTDGTIGTLSRRRAPEKLVVVADALSHFLQPTNPSKRPPVPADTRVFFYERDALNRAPSKPTPLVLVHLESSNLYQNLEPLATSRASKLNSTASGPFHNERCKILSLWSKFAAFMATKMPVEAITKPGGTCYPEPRLVLFQIVGNVRAWWWSNNGSEFDFPDGTKLALSGDGLKARFCYWPEESASSSSPSQLPPSPEPESDGPQEREGIKAKVSRRGTLKSFVLPLETMLSASAAENQDIWETLEANSFKRKLGFVQDVLVMWFRNGGIGECGREKLAFGGLGGAENRSKSAHLGSEDCESEWSEEGPIKLRWSKIAL